MFWGKKKQKQKVYSGFPGDCSPDQIVALQNFKQYVFQNKNLDPHHYNQAYLLRFLRARKFDVTKTKLMWDNFIKWRVKNNIDNYLNFKFPELPELRKMYPHGYHKVDKQFRPIYIERVGSIDVEKIFKVMSTENLLNYYALLYQTLLTTIFDGCSQAKLKATGSEQRVAQTVTILDLKHVKLGSASKAYQFVKPVSAMAQDNYPQILGNMFIINAPMLFTGIWAIVKMWIDDKTKQKIKILGGSYKKQLLEYIEPQNLPDFLEGGKCKCEGGCQLDRNIGPWNPQGKQMLGYVLGHQKQQKKVQQIKQKKVQVKIQQKKQQLKVQNAQNSQKENNQIKVQIVQNVQITDIELAKEQDKLNLQQVTENNTSQEVQKNEKQEIAVMLCINAGLAAEQAKSIQQQTKKIQNEKPEEEVKAEEKVQEKQEKVQEKQEIKIQEKHQQKLQVANIQINQQPKKQQSKQAKQQQTKIQYSKTENQQQQIKN